MKPNELWYVIQSKFWIITHTQQKSRAELSFLLPSSLHHPTARHTTQSTEYNHTQQPISVTTVTIKSFTTNTCLHSSSIIISNCSIPQCFVSFCCSSYWAWEPAWTHTRNRAPGAATPSPRSESRPVSNPALLHWTATPTIGRTLMGPTSPSSPPSTLTLRMNSKGERWALRYQTPFSSFSSRRFYFSYFFFFSESAWWPRYLLSIASRRWLCVL